MSVRAPDSARDFATLALAVLLERMGTTARDLSRLRLELSAAHSAASTPSAPSLAQASMDLERQGWLFGLLARELGSDVLFERRERRGLEYTLWLVQAMLEREAIEMRLPVLPELDTADENGPTICAIVARCVHAAQREQPPVPWGFECSTDGTALCFVGESGAELEHALREDVLRLAGSRLISEPGRTRFFFPATSTARP